MDNLKGNVADRLEAVTSEILAREGYLFNSDKFGKLHEWIEKIKERLVSEEGLDLDYSNLMYRQLKDEFYLNLKLFVELIETPKLLAKSELLEVKQELLIVLKSEFFNNVLKPFIGLLCIAVPMAIVGRASRIPDHGNTIILGGVEQQVSDIYNFIYLNFGERFANVLVGQFTDIATVLGIVPAVISMMNFRKYFKAQSSEDLDRQLKEYIELAAIQRYEPYLFVKNATIVLLGLEILYTLRDQSFDSTDFFVFLIPWIAFLIFRGLESIQLRKTRAESLNSNVEL
jgi:hypothetical protein